MRIYLIFLVIEELYACSKLNIDLNICKTFQIVFIRYPLSSNKQKKKCKNKVNK